MRPVVWYTTSMSCRAEWATQGRASSTSHSGARSSPDSGSTISTPRTGRDLHQAQLRVKGLLAHELGVDADVGGINDSGANVRRAVDAVIDGHPKRVTCGNERWLPPRDGCRQRCERRYMHIHILGISGTFMGGVAALAAAAGHRVSGCDANVYPPMSTQLKNLGIDIHEGFDAAQLDAAPDCVVVATSLPEARRLSRPCSIAAFRTSPGRNGWRNTCCEVGTYSPSPERMARLRRRACSPGSCRTRAWSQAS